MRPYLKANIKKHLEARGFKAIPQRPRQVLQTTDAIEIKQLSPSLPLDGQEPRHEIVIEKRRKS